MQPLKLPEYQPRVREEPRKEILCLVRRKFVALTPEEWVRQHFLNLLITHLGYPKGMIRLEHSMKYFQNAKRSDILVLDSHGEVLLLVECKSFELALDENVVSQVATYNKVLDAHYIAITNGMKHYVWKKEGEEMKQIKDFPTYVPSRNT